MQRWEIKYSITVSFAFSVVRLVFAGSGLRSPIFHYDVVCVLCRKHPVLSESSIFSFSPENCLNLFNLVKISTKFD